MRIFSDANVFLRLADPKHSQYPTALEALRVLCKRGYKPCIAGQVIYEFWVVATRPVDQNGLGFSPERTHIDIQAILSDFDLLPDDDELFEEWLSLVTIGRIKGKNSHDARLVAAMNCHGVSHLLTFNDHDFKSFPGLTVVTPEKASELPAVDQ